VPEECVGHEDDVGRVRHREEQVEGLPLESFVRVLEALDDDHLVVERVLLVDLWGEERVREATARVVLSTCCRPGSSGACPA
jgi:hypothetical protein